MTRKDVFYFDRGYDQTFFDDLWKLMGAAKKITITPDPVDDFVTVEWELEEGVEPELQHLGMSQEELMKALLRRLP